MIEDDIKYWLLTTKRFCEILQFNLESEGYEVIPQIQQKKRLKEPARTRLILLDVMMGGMSGFKNRHYA